jgi:hypothetical protein
MLFFSKTTAYIYVFVMLGLLQEAEFLILMRPRLFTLIQLLILFWLSYNRH